MNYLCDPMDLLHQPWVPGRSTGTGHAQSQNTHNPRRNKFGCAHQHIALCVQSELPGVIGGHLELCRCTLTPCTCTVLFFICCIAGIDAKYIVYPTGLLITQNSKIDKPLRFGLTQVSRVVLSCHICCTYNLEKLHL